MLCKFGRLCAAVLAIAAVTAGPVPVRGASLDAPLTEAQAAREVRIAKRVLTALHPALTKYRSATEIEAAFAAFEQRGNAARSATQMYLAATELAAAIRCGHTWTNVLNQSGAAQTALLESPNKLPLTLALIENRWLVLASADARVSPGDEVVRLNGATAVETVQQMLPYLRADGGRDNKRLRQLSHDRSDFSQMDITWPLLSPPQNGEYEIELRKANGAQSNLRLKAVTLAAREEALRQQNVAPPSSAWAFRIEKNVGVLTLPTFAFFDDKFDWAGFLAASFAELEARRIGHLIIDIRANEGGSDAVGVKLLSYLLREPLATNPRKVVSAYERAPYVLVRYLDTWDYGFFDRTGQVEKIASGPQAGKYWLLPSTPAASVIQPAKAPYRGRAYVLIGAENSSATFLLAEQIKRSKAATLIGQSTSGSARGLNGGALTWVTLPHSGVAIDVPLSAGSYEADTPDTGVAPDIEVPPSFGARAAQRDVEMEAALRVIRKR